MIGELERKKRAGKRSQFIEGSIRARLQQEQAFDIWDLPTEEILDEAVARLRTVIEKDRNTALVLFLARVLK